MESPVPPISLSGHGTPITFDDDIEDLEDGATGLEDLTLKSDSEEDPGREETSFAASEKLPDENHHATATMAKLVKGKDRECPAATEKKGRLQLLDLPIDVLREIINQLPHTNDLTSLALTHSAFHNLTIPYIYSRFDIVWPDSSTHSEPRTGVDALTYGLSTLVMAEEIFDQGAAATAPDTEPYPLAARRRGNWYAQYTKKFSLGNGPADWVQEYLITKESGKMLGTLVSLAIARMRNLETFVWDMPTGVLRDVWLALSSLAHRRDGQPCRLERVWIRWHDNTQVDVANSSPPPPGPLSNLPLAPNGTQASMASAHPLPSAATAVPPLHAIDRVEHPNFSVLPSLKALTVLDVDELPYLDEMSLLIGRSQDKLRELRVGIGRHARQRDWVSVWEGNAVQQVDYSTTRIALSNVGSKRLGGVLGILVGRTYDIRQACATSEPTNLTDTGVPRQDTLSTKTDEVLVPPLSVPHDHSVNELSAQPSDTDVRSMVDVVAPSGTQPTPRDSADGMDVNYEALANRRLGLEILELERVPLAVFVLQKAFDWSKMTQLTLLDCQNHEQLWKALRRTFAPRHSSSVISTGSSTRRDSTAPSDFVLQLKKIHTNTVSPSLVSFIKDALAPNSLEVLFLQEERHYNSAVSIESIYRGALRRHRNSLRKLLIDSSERETDVHFASSTKWRRWMLTREVLSFITSGKMPNLRELAFCIDYRDWHFFLQRLPHIPHIRSLYIPKIADHIHGNNIDSRELALQIVDIVTLRSEIEVCYMGLGEKCFELLENKPSTYDVRAEAGSPDISPGAMPGAYGGNDPLAMTDDETEDEEDDEDMDGEGGAMSGDESISDDSDGHESSDDESLVNEEEKKTPRLRLREILFYDDKVAIFKARHGRL